MDNRFFNRNVRFGNKFLENTYQSISLGSLILLKEDEYSYHHLTFLKTFIAQNINNKTVVISKDIEKLQIPDYKKTKPMTNEDLDKMIIAWRYQNMEKQEENHTFDMGTKMDLNDKKYSHRDNIGVFDEESIICVLSLYSPLWSWSDMEKNLFDIKKQVKQKNCVFIASVPTFLHKNINFNLYFDFVFNFNSYAFTGFFPNYDGIFEIEKALEIGKIKENRFETTKFGFVSNRGGISIEKICIPPEEKQESGCTFTNKF